MGSSDDDLFYPPGYIPSPRNHVNTFLSRPVITSKLKYTLCEAQLRILSCCRDFNISTTTAVNYGHVQQAYELKFGLSLNKSEMKELFGGSCATDSLKRGVTDFLDIISDNSIIKLRLKEGSDEYIQNMEAKYDGELMPKLTDEQLFEILHPILYVHPSRPRFPAKEERKSTFGASSYQNLREASSDQNLREAVHRPRRRGFLNQQVFNRNLPKNTSNRRFQRDNRSSYIRNINDSKSAIPLTTHMNNRKDGQKDVERERFQRVLDHIKEKMNEARRQLEAAKERIAEEVCNEFDTKLNRLIELYYDKLGELENSAPKNNKQMVKNLLEMRK